MGYPGVKRYSLVKRQIYSPRNMNISPRSNATASNLSKSLHKFGGVGLVEIRVVVLSIGMLKRRWQSKKTTCISFGINMCLKRHLIHLPYAFPPIQSHHQTLKPFWESPLLYTLYLDLLSEILWCVLFEESLFRNHPIQLFQCHCHPTQGSGLLLNNENVKNHWEFSHCS